MPTYDSSSHEGADMASLDRTGPPGAILDGPIDNLLRRVADEIGEAKWSVDWDDKDHVKRLELVVTTRTVASKLVVTNRPSTSLKFNRI